MTWVLVLFAGAYALGREVRCRIRVPLAGTLLKVAVDTSVGLGLWGLYLYLLGSFGLLKQWPMRLPALLCLGFFARDFIGRIRSRRVLSFSWPQWRTGVWWLPVGAIMVVSLACCFAPVTGGARNDEVSYHISVAKGWLRAGSLAKPTFPLAFTSGHGELLFAWSQGVHPGAGPRVVSWFFMGLCVLAVAGVSDHRAGATSAAVAAVAFAANPLAFRGAWIAFVDLPASLYLLLSAVLLCDEPDGQRPSCRKVLLAGFLAGTACAFKPTGYFYAPVLGILLVAGDTRRRTGLRGMCARALAFSGATITIAALWPTRTLLITGSPTFPPPLFWYRIFPGTVPVFGHTAVTLDTARDAYAYFGARIPEYGRGMLNFLLLPWNMTMRPEGFQAGDSVGALPLSALLPVLLCKKPRWLSQLLVFAVASTGVIYAVLLPEARYLLPAFMVLSIACGWFAAEAPLGTVVGKAFAAALAINVAFGVLVCARIAAGPIARVFVPGEREKALNAEIPYFETFRFLNAHSQDTVVTLFDDGVWHCYLEKTVVPDPQAMEHPNRYSGCLLLDVDGSQMTERKLSALSGAFAVSDSIPGLEKVYEAVDARVYRFAKSSAGLPWSAAP